jgi:hypothetical protein
VVCRTQQRLHPYDVRRVQTLQPNDYILWQQFCQSAIQNCGDQPDFLRTDLFTDEAGFKRNGVFNIHNTHIQVRDNLHRRAQPCIRNHSRHFEQFLWFLLCFSFLLVFTLSYLTRFCGSVYLKCFWVISFIVRLCHFCF